MDITNETPVNLTSESLNTDEAVINHHIGLQIRVEWLLYAAIILLALVLRLPELGTTPLNDAQSHEALAAFRVVTPTSAVVDGVQAIPRYPLMFSANTLLMTVTGTGTPTVLLPTALLGVLLIFLPMLFRRWLGQANALILSCLLLMSPILLLSSRSMTGSIWSMMLAVIALYCIARCLESSATGYALAATSFIVLLVLMAEPAGFITFLGLAAGLFFASRPRDNSANSSYRTILIAYVRHWPYLRGVAISAVIVGLTATVFLLYPRGLSNIGEVIGGACSMSLSYGCSA
jgi:predicted membrane-bound mannosyltransferase